jgi:hypothetical protein
MVLAHARALLARGRHTRVVAADLRRPQTILDNPTVRAHLDWTQPLAVLVTAVLHLLPDADDPAAAVAAVRDAVPPGSHLVVSHATTVPETAWRGTHDAVRAYRTQAGPFHPRTPAEIHRLLTGWTLLPPGLVPLTQRHPDPDTTMRRATPRHPPEEPPIPVLAAVARAGSR